MSLFASLACGGARARAERGVTIGARPMIGRGFPRSGGTQRGPNPKSGQVVSAEAANATNATAKGLRVLIAQPAVAISLIVLRET